MINFLHVALLLLLFVLRGIHPFLFFTVKGFFLIRLEGQRRYFVKIVKSCETNISSVS